jgi:predicted sulfurtransferase
LAVPPVRRCPQEILRTCASEQAGDNMPILSVNTELDFSLPYRVLAFYAIAPVAAPDDAVAEHRQYLLKHDMVGRVYICADGLNAQVSGTTASCEAYRAFAAAAFPGIQLFFKEDPVAEPAFPKLRVKHKALVPGVAVDLNARGEDVEPERWAAMIAQGDGIGAPQPTILDVRNGYEWDVGHFEGAERPTLDEFAEFDAAAYGLPTDPEAKKSTPVMMYCTGGIRCEYFSAKLKAEGFEKVYKLQGGVQHYGNTMAARGGAARVQEEVQAAAAAAAEQVAEHGPPSSASSSSGSSGSSSGSGSGHDGGGSESGVSSPLVRLAAREGKRRGKASTASTGPVPHWQGSMFVFDRRNTVRFGAEGTVAIGSDSIEPIGQCEHCSAKTEAFINCVRAFRDTRTHAPRATRPTLPSAHQAIDCEHVHALPPSLVDAVQHRLQSASSRVSAVPGGEAGLLRRVLQRRASPPASRPAGGDG